MDSSPVDVFSGIPGSTGLLFDGLVRHDRLLTDSLGGGISGGVGFFGCAGLMEGCLPVKSEHSYSLAGSDGDSIPDSPLSSNDAGKKSSDIACLISSLKYRFLYNDRYSRMWVADRLGNGVPDSILGLLTV